MEDSGNDGPLEFCIKNQGPWHKLSGKIPHMLNELNSGDCRIFGSPNSRLKKLRNTPKVYKIITLGQNDTKYAKLGKI